VAADADGNVYVSGSSQGSLGPKDVWVAKYSTTGALRWTRELHPNSYLSPGGVATGSNGNVYITGSTAVSLGGANQGGNDAFVAKYSSAGSLLWIRQLGTSDGDASFGIATDGAGNVYISGWTAGSLGGANQGGNDAFVAKYSPAGVLLWTRQLGTSVHDYSNSVATDGDGNVYISGYTYGSLTGANVGATDAFVAKYSSAGTLRWARQLGTSGYDNSHSVATDGDGNVYISGWTSGSLGGANQGGNDAFVARYSPAGVLLWAKQIGISGDDYSYGVATDGDGNVYISGWTAGSLGGANQGGDDAFVATYSSAGALRWTRQLGTSGYEHSYGVATGRHDDLYISGVTTGSLGGAFQGGTDAFVAKYSTAGSLLSGR
jgi:hypothetical protein